MNVAPELLRAVAHELLDVAVVSGVLALVALAVVRIPGVGAGTRSRWWSAVAVVPLLAFAGALLQPPALREGATRAIPAPISGAVLIDPFDTLRTVTPMPNPAPAAAGVRDTGSVSAAAPRAPFPWLPLALALWFVVAAARLVRVIGSVVGAYRIAARSVPVSSSASAASANLGGVARDARDARVELRVCAALDTPSAVGLTHRAVVVPERLARCLPAAELRAVVLHEIAHLRRRDHWVHLLERVACAVLWFDPIVVLAVRASATWREVACDESAARVTGARACATALWRSASLMSGGTSRSTALALLPGGGLVDRVETLLRPRTTSRSRTVAASLALVLFASTASALVLARVPAYAASGPAVAGLSATGSMHTRRASFAFVKLRNGRVLVAGGMIANQNFTRAAEIYDPARGVFEPTGSMLEGRVGPSGTLLQDGRVLVAGGWTSKGLTASAELYDPATGTFSAAAPMHRARGGHSATRLRDGTVLFTGGEESESARATAEIYDPARGTFAEIGPMLAPRGAYTATLLEDGRVLIAGGLEGRVSVRTTELYEPAARRFIPGPQMLAARSKHGGVLLADGSVLITGGAADYTWHERLASAERYDPRANRFIAAGTMHAKRFKLRDAMVRLPSGDVLVAGGSDRVELYDAASDRFRLVDPFMPSARNLGAALLLDDGSVLIAGGYDSVDPLPTTETAQRYRM